MESNKTEANEIIWVAIQLIQRMDACTKSDVLTAFQDTVDVLIEINKKLENKDV